MDRHFLSGADRSGRAILLQGAASGETDTSTQGSDVTVDQGLDLSPEVGVELGLGGSYQNLDGSTTTWSHDVDVDAALDLGTTLDGAGSMGTSETGGSDGSLSSLE